MKSENKKSPILILIIFVLSITCFSSCSSEEEQSSKSMDQIQTEEGIPVKVDTLQYQPFTKYLSFFAKLSGIKESTKGAAIGGRIEKINAKVGDYVRKDQVIVEFPTDSPASQFEQAKTAYENFKKNYDRLKSLLEAGETSQSTFDGAEAQYFVSKSNFETQKQMILIDAPYDGTITGIMVSEGDNVKEKESLFTIAQLNIMKAKIWASESEIKKIKKGMTAIAKIDDKEYKGRVTEISLGLDQKMQAFYAEVQFKNPNRELKSGLTADIKITVYDNPKAILVQRNLVKADEKGSYVFVENNSAAEKRYISNGNDSGLTFEIKNGLQPGDRLIVKGSARLVNGSKVKVIQ